MYGMVVILRESISAERRECRLRLFCFWLLRMIFLEIFDKIIAQFLELFILPSMNDVIGHPLFFLRYITLWPLWILSTILFLERKPTPYRRIVRRSTQIARQKRKMTRSSAAVILFALLAAAGSVGGFQTSATLHTRLTVGGLTVNRRSQIQSFSVQWSLAFVTTTNDRSTRIALNDSKSGNDGGSDQTAVDDSFDGKGFANYLAPYAWALVASIGLTALFFKFVLLDY